MKLSGIPCVACGKKFTPEDDIVVCPECGAPLGRSPGSHCKRCGRAYDWDKTPRSNSLF